MDNNKTAIIIGAGPAGLTAAYELLKRTKVKPVIFEISSDIGGISKTVNYKGNRMDIGGHRFFSKSDRVMEWWKEILPIQGFPSKDDLELDLTYHNRKRKVTLLKDGPDPEKTDRVMLIRSRLSRIYYLRKFFNYPITLNINTISNLGVIRVVKISISYIWNRIFPIKKELSLEDFFINRFGKVLYKTFFKDYTEKVWGISCDKISAEWGAQRVRGLSISKAIKHALKSINKKSDTIGQKNTETSLIEKFMYPKYGPGHLWEEVARRIKEMGGIICMNKKVVGFKVFNNTINKVVITDLKSGEKEKKSSDYIFSSMPVKDLINGMNGNIPDNIRQIANGLVYRDFITVGVLCKKLKIKNNTEYVTINNIVPDNWIYIQERDVKLGRLQIFNNWSPYMVADKNTIWLGLEYFCNEGDELWSKTDLDFRNFAIEELVKIGIVNKEDVIDSTIIRMPKTYPAYFGTYDKFNLIIDFSKSIKNLYLIGRNGMHKYNNQDHSMLTAMIAIDNIEKGIIDKDNIWEVNTEEEYHEKK